MMRGESILAITNLHLVYIIVFVNTHALVTPEKSGHFSVIVDHKYTSSRFKTENVLSEVTGHLLKLMMVASLISSLHPKSTIDKFTIRHVIYYCRSWLIGLTKVSFFQKF